MTPPIAAFLAGSTTGAPLPPRTRRVMVAPGAPSAVAVLLALIEGEAPFAEIRAAAHRAEGSFCAQPPMATLREARLLGALIATIDHVDDLRRGVASFGARA